MSKMFYTNGVGSTQTLEPAQPLKMRVYSDREAAEGDIASLAEGELIATQEDGTAADTDSYITQLVKGIVEPYVQKQFLLSDQEHLASNPGSSWTYTAEYDGYIYLFSVTSSGSGYVNYILTDSNGNNVTFGTITGGTVTVPIAKGQTLKYSVYGSVSTRDIYGAFYKNRDYTGR